MTRPRPQQRVVERALAWIAANLASFRLPTIEDDENAGAATIEERRKAFGELCLASMLMSRSAATPLHPHRAAISAHIFGEIRRTDAFFDMMRRPALFPLYVTLVTTMGARGAGFERERGAIQRILDRGHIDAVDRTPWNMLDVGYFLDLGGFRHGLPDPATLYPLSIACRLPPIPDMRRADVYAITHILFFLSDFGRLDMRERLGSRYAATCEYVELLLAVETSRSDWDLVGELLLSCACLGIEPEPQTGLAWEALDGAQMEGGQIPGPEHDTAGRGESDLTPEPEDDFRHNYHPTLVALIAAVTAGASREAE